MSPLVTFVVPCYKLAHLLAECIDSILAQTFTDFEILIMDDCSPDNTPEVAQSYKDPRVKHIRNEVNLRHLRNYNKGIEIARGKYVWLISADDCLRKPYLLQRYVEVLESNAAVGYAFCPAVRLENGVQGEVLDYSVHGEHDAIWNGREFLRKLLMANTIVAPTGIVRKECYDKVSLFPLDMPWGGDWYLWCVFALHYDVAYLAEPMVCYRRHSGSMTNQLTTQSLHVCAHEDAEFPWIMKRKCEEAGYPELGVFCLRSAAEEYARSIYSKTYKTAIDLATTRMTVDEFEASLAQHTAVEKERRIVRAHTFATLGNFYLWEERPGDARPCFARSLRARPWNPRVASRWLLSSLGPAGNGLRRGLRAMRRTAAADHSNA